MTAVPADPPARLHPLRRARRTTTARRPSPLARTVESAIARLDGPTDLDHASRTTVDRQLRTALARHVGRVGEGGHGVPAVRVACAHLAAGDVEGSYLALLTARDLLG
jgi:hypothetical protein